MTIRTVLVDDQEMYRLGFRMLLESQEENRLEVMLATHRAQQAAEAAEAAAKEAAEKEASVEA